MNSPDANLPSVLFSAMFLETERPNGPHWLGTSDNIKMSTEKLLIWVQSIQAGQQPYQVEVASELGGIHELKLAILKEEQISLSPGHLYLRMGRYGSKASIRDKLIELYPHGYFSDYPFWYVFLCPAHYGNLRLCQKGMFEPKRIKFPVSILKHDRQESEVDVTSGTNTAGTTSTSGEPACAKPRVTFYESVNP